MYHSFSSWSLFKECPFAWFGRYVSKTELKRPDSPALIKGREAHRFMEETVKNGLLEAERGKIAENVFAELKTVTEGAKAVKTEQDIFCDYTGKVIQRDWSNPAGIILKIDLLVVNNEGLYMGDYKTGKSRGKKDQLSLYSIPFGGNVNCGFLYLDQNYVERFKITKEDMEDAKKRFMEYIDYTEDKRSDINNFPKKDCMNCKWCCNQACKLAGGLNG